MKPHKKRARARHAQEPATPPPSGARDPLPARPVDHSEPAEALDREQSDVERFAVSSFVGPDEPAVDRDLEH